MLTDPKSLAAKAWEDACHGTDAENIAAIAAVYAPLVESLSNDAELLTIAWMDGSHSSNTAHRARIAELEAEVERLREALKDVASRANAHVARTALGASHDD